METLILILLSGLGGYVVSFFVHDNSAKLKSVERRLVAKEEVIIWHSHNRDLAHMRIRAQNRELETLHKALYAKRGETGKVILGVFNGGKNA